MVSSPFRIQNDIKMCIWYPKKQCLAWWTGLIWLRVRAYVGLTRSPQEVCNFSNHK